MTRVSLSDAGDYGLVNDEQDVRGFSVVDGNGQPLGTVESMLIDTDAEVVTTLVLEDGTEIPVADVTLGDHVVTYAAASNAAAGLPAAGLPAEGTAATGSDTPSDDIRSGVTVFDDRGKVVRRERVEGQTADASAFDADFEAHHAATYGASGRGFNDTRAAYQYGYASAHGDSTRNQAYADAEPGLRAGYDSGDFDADREAVRYGYGRAQRRAQ